MPVITCRSSNKELSLLVRILLRVATGTSFLFVLKYNLPVLTVFSVLRLLRLCYQGGVCFIFLYFPIWLLLDSNFATVDFFPGHKFNIFFASFPDLYNLATALLSL
jgi:hypothetical protein